MPTLKITCKGSCDRRLEDLEEFQGELKSLEEGDYDRLRGELEREGFSFPVSIWRNKIIDGHQRTRVVRQMRADGWKIPRLPCVEIDAESELHAKRKVLAAASQYGKIQKQGLYEFMNLAELPMLELETKYTFPEIRMSRFREEFFEDVNRPEDDTKKPSEPSEPKEPKQAHAHTCPMCGHGWG